MCIDSKNSLTCELDNISKIQTVCLSTPHSDEKINVMLQAGWKILDKYKTVGEEFPYQYYSTLFFVLGHEDSSAQIPLTEWEINEQREREEYRKCEKERQNRLWKEISMNSKESNLDNR